ncbi:hypothetical protein A4D02_34395 [Niastella koreensis]|nr:YdcF family protein [Niastella koreensis]OQP45049.1 hypothetical protein A4D02_34395 [Niastella koreensis]
MYGNAPMDAIRARLERSTRAALKNCQTAPCFGNTLQFTQAEIQTIGNELVRLVVKDSALRACVQQLKADGHYALFTTNDDTAFIRKAWQADARGVNNILRVYVEGYAPLYPKIDSISFQKDSPAFRDSIVARVEKVLDRYGKKMICLDLPVRVALEALQLNGREVAVQYEHDYIGGGNDWPFARSRHTKWDSFPYSMILVPGLGPEQPGVALDPGGARRCDSAAIRYKAKLAPFIVVSGGHVHPNKTPYCEAIEMRRYLMEVHHIPVYDIIIEPYARHTTTNLRNTSRFVFEEKMPADKPILIVSDSAQTNYINGAMKDKVVKELGYTPFSSIKKISATETEYLPAENSRQINSMDPLDP